MRKIVTLLFGAFVTLSVTADPIDLNQAKHVAQYFLQGKAKQRKAVTAELKLVWSDAFFSSKTRAINEAPTYYVFNTTDAPGFVVVSGDDAAYPILAYSTTQLFQADEMPENVQTWLNGYQQQIMWVRENPAAVSDEVKNAWERVRQGTLTPQAAEIELKTALWNQGEPFNYLCPVFNEKRSPAGCGAVTMAIVMKYHQWPDKGEGSESYVTSTHQCPLSVVYNTPYDWTQMPSEYIYGEATDAQIKNVSTLMFHCGVAAQMNYDISGSGTKTAKTVIGMIQHFKYDKGAQYLSKVSHTEAEWNALLQKEIQENRPIIYSGQQANNGSHLFILDGYNENKYYHVNWGWGGVDNGYYLLDALNLSNGWTYNLGQEAIIGIRPSMPDSKYCDNLGFKYVIYEGVEYKGLSSTVNTIQRDKKFYVNIGFISNLSLREWTTQLMVALFDKDGKQKQIISGPIDKTFKVATLSALKSEPCKITTDLAPGDRIRLIYKNIETGEWKWVKGGGKAPGEILVDDPTAMERVENNANLVLSFDTKDLLQLRSLETIETVALYALNGGKAIPEQRVHATETTLSLRSLATGTYILKVTTANGSRRYKIHKK
ncbi:MAG: thiol protease/hemagglutinin PrtT [Bacteroidaceae bacterium]